MRNKHTSAADWRDTTNCLGELAVAQSLAELDLAAPPALRRLFGADLVVWERYDQRLIPASYRMDPMLSGNVSELHQVFKEHFHQHPAFGSFDHGFRHGMTYIMSDFCTTRRLVQTGLWSEVYIHLRAKHQLGLTGPLADGTLQGMSANRLCRDFGPREREIARFLRPRLFALASAAARRDRAASAASTLAAVAQSAAHAFVAPDGRILEASAAWHAMMNPSGNEQEPPASLPAEWHALRATLGSHDSKRVFRIVTVTLTLHAVVLWLGSGPAWVVLQESAARKDTRLTNRESEILTSIAAGGSNAAIAAQLGISPRTVAKHCTNLFAKIGVESRFAAALQARANGATAPWQVF